MFTILAVEWNRFTGLPFVFAVWAVRSAANLGEQVQIFYQSREQGLKEIDSIASVYSKKLVLRLEKYADTSWKTWIIPLDQENLRGLQTFFDTAAELGLTASSRSLQFYPVG